MWFADPNKRKLRRAGCRRRDLYGRRVNPTRFNDLTQGVGVRYALDAVGGPTGTAVIQALASGGCLLVYGTLSGEPLALDSRTLMVGGKSIRGFWLQIGRPGRRY